MTILLVIGGTVVGTGLLWIACGRLEEATSRLSTHYGIPEIVQGSLLLAVSSSIPELATAALALPVHHDFELGVSAIIGSAIYNILVIPAASVFARGEPMKSTSALVYREALFYLFSVAAVMVVLSLSVVYGGTVAADGTPVEGRLTPALALVPIFLYAIYLYIQYAEFIESPAPEVRDGTISAAKEWLVLILMIGLILVGVEMLLRVAITLAELLNTPTFLWGMTVVAGATSLPDTFISIRASMQGRTTSSLSNVLGSNVFDLLVAIPAGVLIAGVVTVNFTQVVPMMTFLMVATIVMIVAMRRDWEVSRNEASVMLALYAGFGVWMGLEAFGFTNVLGIH